MSSFSPPTSVDKIYTNKKTIAEGRFSTIQKCFVNEDPNQIFALKIIDIDEGEINPHSLKCEKNIMRYLTKLGAINEKVNVIELIIDYQLKGEYYFVLPYYEFTLMDYLKKNSRIITNFKLLYDDNNQGAEDPIDKYFTIDDDDSIESPYSRKNKIEPIKCLKIIKKIFNGLNFIHNNGIIHRDIKPENILLNSKNLKKDDDLNPVICDFGISYFDEKLIKNPEALKIFDNYRFDRKNEMNSNEKVTQISTGIFKPPEVILGIRDYNTEVDIWSFGITISQLFSINCLPILHKSGNFNDISLLQSIFQNFGTPNIETWPKLKEVEIFGNFAFTNYETKSIEKILPLVKNEVDEIFKIFKEEIFIKMMIYDETKRLTASEALKVFERIKF